MFHPTSVGAENGEGLASSVPFGLREWRQFEIKNGIDEQE